MSDNIPAELHEEIAIATDKAIELREAQLKAYGRPSQNYLDGFSDGHEVGATEYAIWKVRCDQAKVIFEKILVLEHQNYDNEITIGPDLINEIKSFLDGQK